MGFIDLDKAFKRVQLTTTNQIQTKVEGKHAEPILQS